METEIVFCERCGVSIPEQDLVRVRQSSGGRDLCTACAAPPRADGDLRLYFCENCRISIAVSDVLTGSARTEGPGYLCPFCSRGTPAERMARRTAVEREMAAPPAGAPRPAVDPIYFCDACNSSIPAPLVASGRALVKGGRTYCERCRPRMEGERVHARPGIGVAPVLAAALLAAVATAGGFVAWERVRATEDGKDQAAALDATIADLRRDLRATRSAAEGGRESGRQAAEGLKDAERRLEGLRAEIQGVRTAAEKSAARPTGAERIPGLEKRIDDLGEQLQSLREDVAQLASMRTRAPAPPEETAPPEPPPPEAGTTGPGPAAAPQGPGPEVQKRVAGLEDKDPGVRFANAIELGKLGDRSAARALARHLKGDDDPFVRRACGRSIGELKAYEVFPELVDSMADPEEYVAVQSARVIQEMAGQDFGFKQNQPRGDRKKAQERARRWWEENRERLLEGQ